MSLSCNLQKEEIPDLNILSRKAEYELKRLEYWYPQILISDLALPRASSYEHIELNSQIAKWSNIHRKDKGFIGNVFGGFAFGGYDHREYQLIPDASYVDQQTALTISPRDCQKAYVPCVPTVVIQIVSEVDDISQLKKKMSIFLKHGTREGLIVDSQRNEMWIYNSRFRFPSKHSLGTVIFDYWPGFELDCKAIREFRKHFLDSL